MQREVRGAVVMLRADFAKGSGELGGAYIRHFKGESRRGELVGEVTRKVDSGDCWGFDVLIPDSWLQTGEGVVKIGDVKKFPPEMCRED